MFLVVGCSECSLDSCNYNPEKIAVWSETDNSLAVIIEDLGEKDEQKDNREYLYKLDLDGSNFEKVSSISSNESISYLNESNQYVVIEGRIKVNQYYKKIDLINRNSLILSSVDSTPCLDYKVIPSLNGNYIARIKIQGQENGELQFSESSGNVTVTKEAFYYENNLSSNIGCSSFILEIEFIDVLTGVVQSKVISSDPDLSYRVYQGNKVNTYLVAFWGQAGLIIHNYDLTNINTEYALIEINGDVSSYTKPDECGQRVTSSGRYSQAGAQAIVVGFNGATEAVVTITEDVAQENVVCLP